MKTYRKPNGQLHLGSVTFGGSGGIMTTAITELPYQCVSQAKSLGKIHIRSNLVQRICGIRSASNMQVRNSKLCEASKCRPYRAINHPLWVSMLFHRRGLLWLALLFVTKPYFTKAPAVRIPRPACKVCNLKFD